MLHFVLLNHFTIMNICCFLSLPKQVKGPDGSMSQVVGLPNNSYKHITNTAWVRARFCKLQKGYTRLAAASDKVYQLLAHDRWFSPGTPASSTTKTGHHDKADILLKVALKTKNQITKPSIITDTPTNVPVITHTCICFIILSLFVLIYKGHFVYDHDRIVFGFALLHLPIFVEIRLPKKCSVLYLQLFGSLTSARLPIYYQCLSSPRGMDGKVMAEVVCMAV